MLFIRCRYVSPLQRRPSSSPAHHLHARTKIKQNSTSFMITIRNIIHNSFFFQPNISTCSTTVTFYLFLLTFTDFIAFASYLLGSSFSYTFVQTLDHLISSSIYKIFPLLRIRFPFYPPFFFIVLWSLFISISFPSASFLRY
jgi:hypothetical protein